MLDGRLRYRGDSIQPSSYSNSALDLDTIPGAHLDNLDVLYMQGQQRDTALCFEILRWPR